MLKLNKKKEVAMKKYYILIAIFICYITNFNVTSFGNDVHTVQINSKTFELKYSNCFPKSPACLNEYYKPKEFNNKWTELFTVVYRTEFRNKDDFTKAIMEANPLSNLVVKEKNYNIIELYFPYLNDNNVESVEINVLKIMSVKGGIISMQYATRQKFDKNNPDKSHKKFQKIVNKYTTILQEMPAMSVYKKPLQKW